MLGFKGAWDDDVLGWSDELSPTFTAHQIPEKHNHAMFHPEAVAVLRAALDASHAAHPLPPHGEVGVR
jgi:hypothetical protein